MTLTLGIITKKAEFPQTRPLSFAFNSCLDLGSQHQQNNANKLINPLI